MDERTLEPIAEALVATRTSSSPTDREGWFDTGEPLDELSEIDVLNVARNTSVKEVPRARWTKLADSWQIPLAIGPTYRLRLSALDETVTVPWEGRLVRDEEHADRWATLGGRAPPYLRYDAPIADPRPGERLWVEVRSTDGLWQGRGEAHSTVGIHEVDILCRARAVLRGRIVDEAGAPWSVIEVEAVQSTASERSESAARRTGTAPISSARRSRAR